jgi:hypothetical protein
VNSESNSLKNKSYEIDKRKEAGEF